MEAKTTLSKRKRSLETIPQLPLEKRSNYTPFLIGNDTPLTSEQIAEHQINQDFILVGTALFRSIDIACKLAQNEGVFPTVVIVDNSQKVSEAWEKIKAFFAEEQDDIVDDTLDFILDELMDIAIIDTTGFQTNSASFFTHLFEKHSPEYVKRIISELVVLEQDWGSKATFSDIQQHAGGMPIAVYASNIISYVPAEEQANVLTAIHALSPCVSFCTNLDATQRKPTQSYVFPDSSPHVIASALALSQAVQEEVSRNMMTTAPLQEPPPPPETEQHIEVGIKRPPQEELPPPERAHGTNTRNPLQQIDANLPKKTTAAKENLTQRFKDELRIAVEKHEKENKKPGPN
ncbi:MAG: hypothetical protein K0U37_02970 [Gammaproteobacteria bacterium]|nr:hypothetical protein [Gammaproteobacteria bacterium]